MHAEQHLGRLEIDLHGPCSACSKPVKRAELLARISAHLRVRADNSWVNTLVNGAMQDNAEAMRILKSILPEPIITRLQARSPLA